MAIEGPIPRERHVKLTEKGRLAGNRILDAIVGKEDIVDWDPVTKEVIIDGNVLKYSNIEEILARVTKLHPAPTENKRKKMSVTYFLKALGKAGVSPNLIPNNIMRKIVKVSRDSATGYGARIRWYRFK